MKIYMVILDGAADRPIKTLGNKTPLEFANTSALDILANNGEMGYISVIDEKITPESDSGAMALLSYDPLLYYPGRGTLEGLGTGFIPYGYNYVAFRVNFASYDEKNKKLDRRTARGLEDTELQALAKEISENVSLSKYDVQFKLLAFGHHRGILCFYSKTVKLSGNVSNTDPGFRKDGVWGTPVANYLPEPQKSIPLDDLEETKVTANIVNDFSEQVHNILNNSNINKERIANGLIPANYLIIRDGGSSPIEMPKFKEKFGLNLSMYGQLPAENAIANLIGGTFNYSKSLDLQLDKDFLINMEKKFIKDTADIVFIHIKGPDEPGHDNKPFEKVKAIELIDKYFIQNLLQDINKDDIVVTTCDHATPCELKLHSTDKVPVLISGNKFKNDNSKKFDENNAKSGSCNIKTAKELLPYILEKLKG